MFYHIVLSILSFISTTAFARGGGGGSGGGGGGGGGSFGGGSYGGGGSSGGSSDWISLIIFLIIIISAIITFLMHKHRIKQTEKKLAETAVTDPIWKEDNLKNTVQDIFMRFQKDWSEFNVTSMKEYVADDYYKRMVLELNVLQNEHRKNTMENVSIIALSIESFDNEVGDREDTFTASITAVATDSLVDTDTNKILYTDPSTFTEYWTFLRDGNNWKLGLIRQETEDVRMIESSIVDFAAKNNFYYDADFGWLMMPNKGVIFSGNNFTTTDINNHVIGYYKEKIVEFYTFIGNTRSNFSSNYVVAQTVLPISYKDILVRKRRSLFNFSPRGLRRIQTESVDFDKKFCLWADPQDQISSFELLSTNFMEKIYALPFELNIEIVGNVLYLYAKDRANISYDTMLEILSWAFEEMKM